MSRHAARRADDIAEQVFCLLVEHDFSLPQTFDEEAAELRTAAFCFTRDVHGSEPLIVLARDMAAAVLELLSQSHAVDSVEKLQKASNAYEQARSIP